MALLGKINLAELAPNHPFVRGSIQFMPTPKIKASDNTKPEEHVKKLHNKEMAKLATEK